MSKIFNIIKNKPVLQLFFVSVCILGLAWFINRVSGYSNIKTTNNDSEYFETVGLTGVIIYTLSLLFSNMVLATPFIEEFIFRYFIKPKRNFLWYISLFSFISFLCRVTPLNYRAYNTTEVFFYSQRMGGNEVNPVYYLIDFLGYIMRASNLEVLSFFGHQYIRENAHKLIVISEGLIFGLLVYFMVEFVFKKYFKNFFTSFLSQERKEAVSRGFIITSAVITSMSFIYAHRWYENMNLSYISMLVCLTPITAMLVYFRVKHGIITSILAHSFINYVFAYVFVKTNIANFIIINTIYIIFGGLILWLFSRTIKQPSKE